MNVVYDYTTLDVIDSEKPRLLKVTFETSDRVLKAQRIPHRRFPLFHC